MEDKLGYLPLSQYVTEPLKQSELPDLDINSTTYVDAKNKIVRDFVGIATSFGKKYKVPAADLAKGLFSNATELTIPEGTTQSENIIFPGLKNKSSEFYYYPVPTEEDYQLGILRRYFLQDVRTTEIKEIDAETYKDIQNKGYYRRVKVEWNLKGPSADQTVNGYIYPGAEARNRDVVAQAEEVIPGISDVLKDLKQFVREQPSELKQVANTNKTVAVGDPRTQAILEKTVATPEPVVEPPIIQESELEIVNTESSAADSTSLAKEQLSFLWYSVIVGTPSYSRRCSPFIGVSMKLYNQFGDFFEKDGTLKKQDFYLYRTKNEAVGNVYKPIRKATNLIDPRVDEPINNNLYYIIQIEGVGSYTAKFDLEGKIYEIERC